MCKRVIAKTRSVAGFFRSCSAEGEVGGSYLLRIIEVMTRDAVLIVEMSCSHG